MTDRILEAIDRVSAALDMNPNSRWILGFSGGKDSTSVLKIFVSGVRAASARPRSVDVIYCDTGVENPILDRYVKRLLAKLSDEFSDYEIPMRTHLLMAPIRDRFFVKIIGRGYPPPTNSFRWCTKNLRISPVSRFIEDAAKDEAIVVLGMRSSESQQRDRSLQRNGGGFWQTQVEGRGRYRLFLPILDLEVPEVWDSIFVLPRPRAIEPQVLEALYRGAAGECPIIKSPQAAPCATGRFGCWTCTVVRKDRSSRALVEAGHAELIPYLEFRDWLADIRNDPARRWPVRRNGKASPGPFSLAARREILARLESVGMKVGVDIVSKCERVEIERLWSIDEQRDSELMGTKYTDGDQTDCNLCKGAADAAHCVVAPGLWLPRPAPQG